MTRKLTKKQLQEQVDLLLWNNELGCYTRQAFENIIWPDIADQAVWGIFFDVDRMKSLNAKHGWDGASRIIKESIEMRSTDSKAGQVLSGDEFFVAVTENRKRAHTDPLKLCQRILAEFKARGASATFAYGRITSQEYQDNLKPLKEAVFAAKKRRRGTINFVPQGRVAMERES